jgi:hypothetical protein
MSENHLDNQSPQLIPTNDISSALIHSNLSEPGEALL